MLEFYRHNYIKSHLEVDKLFQSNKISITIKFFKKFIKKDPEFYLKDIENNIKNTNPTNYNYFMFKSNLFAL
jgi:hypothetical protein